MTRIQTNAGVRGALGLMAGLWVGLSAGCFSVPIPQAEADPARFYVLTTTSPVVAPAGQAKIAMHLQPVEVASYLRSRPMVVRRGENEIQFREFARWGEPLELGIGRVLREELLARAAANHVLTSGVRSPGEKYDYSLTVRVLACEGGADGSIYFRAIWELAPTTEAAAGVARGEYRPTNLRWDGRTEATLAEQLSVAVAGLAGEIGAAVKR